MGTVAKGVTSLLGSVVPGFGVVASVSRCLDKDTYRITTSSGWVGEVDALDALMKTKYVKWDKARKYTKGVAATSMGFLPDAPDGYVFTLPPAVSPGVAHGVITSITEAEVGASAKSKGEAWLDGVVAPMLAKGRSWLRGEEAKGPVAEKPGIAKAKEQGLQALREKVQKYMLPNGDLLNQPVQDWQWAEYAKREAERQRANQQQQVLQQGMQQYQGWLRNGSFINISNNAIAGNTGMITYAYNTLNA